MSSVGVDWWENDAECLLIPTTTTIVTIFLTRNSDIVLRRINIVHIEVFKETPSSLLISILVY